MNSVAKTAAGTSGSGTRRVRVALIAVGVLLLVTGGLVLLDGVAPDKYLGILYWFAGAIIIHDGVIAVVTFGFALALRKAGRRVPFAVLAIVQGAIVVGAVMALVVFPEIYKKAISTPKPTVLPFDYGTNLVLFYAALIVVTAAVIGLYLRFSASRARVVAS